MHLSTHIVFFVAAACRTMHVDVAFLHLCHTTTGSSAQAGLAAKVVGGGSEADAAAGSKGSKVVSVCNGDLRTAELFTGVCVCGRPGGIGEGGDTGCLFLCWCENVGG